MLKKIFIIFIVIILLINSGNSLKCWKCNGCETVPWNKETCKTVNTQTQQVGCITQIVDELSSRTRMTIKKCGIHDKNQSFKCQDLPDTQAISCQICNDDLCNTGTQLQIILYYSGSLMILIWIHRILT